MNTSERTGFIARIGLLLAFALIVQMAGLPQPITGPLINTVLLLSTWMFGPLSGIVVGSLTPIIALGRGQLPAILAPMVPFIITANILLVTVFYLIMKNMMRFNTGRWIISTFTASVLKTLTLYGAVILIMPLMIGERLPRPVEWMMSLPQLIAALAGGLLTFLLVRIQPTLFASGWVSKR